MVVVVRRQNVKTNTQSNFEPPRGDSMQEVQVCFVKHCCILRSILAWSYQHGAS
jgi:hypothetical protein